MQHAAVALARYYYVIGSSPCYGRSRELTSARHLADEAWPPASYITGLLVSTRGALATGFHDLNCRTSSIELDDSVQEPFDDLAPRTRLLDECQEKLSCVQKIRLMPHVQ